MVRAPQMGRTSGRFRPAAPFPGDIVIEGKENVIGQAKNIKLGRFNGQTDPS